MFETKIKAEGFVVAGADAMTDNHTGSDFQGRVLYDLIIYNKSQGGEKPSYLIECEKEVSAEFLSAMKKYKIRKKVFENFYLNCFQQNEEVSQT